MSMWVRLVGGLGNGEVKKIDDDQVEIVVRKSTPPPVTRLLAGGALGIAGDTMEVKTARYTRRVIHTPGGDITYFAVEGFSDFEALHHVLGP